VPVGEAVMVGDTPETDVRGAQLAGLRAVWLNRGHQDWPRHLARPDAVIEELGQLPRVLRQLDQQARDGSSNRPGTQNGPER
jgi:FMN hydrolase / 5-amino-6-(5-phospho-D-ribitylamino)uracil phosphatase